MAYPARVPFVVPFTTTPLNIKAVPVSQQQPPLPPVTPLSPRHFFFTGTGAPGAGKIRVAPTQLFPNEKENHIPVQTKAHKKQNFKKNKKFKMVADRGIQKKHNNSSRKYNIGPISLGDEIEIEIEFTINKK